MFPGRSYKLHTGVTHYSFLPFPLIFKVLHYKYLLGTEIITWNILSICNTRLLGGGGSSIFIKMVALAAAMKPEHLHN